MGIVAPAVLKILEKTGAYVNTVFLQKKIFWLKLIKIETEIINKLRLAMETVSRALYLAPISFISPTRAYRFGLSVRLSSR